MQLIALTFDIKGLYVKVYSSWNYNSYKEQGTVAQDLSKGTQIHVARNIMKCHHVERAYALWNRVKFEIIGQSDIKRFIAMLMDII